MRTEDGITVKPGALVWYVNYFGDIKPIVFNKIGKSSVKYFALRQNAQKYLEDHKNEKFYGLGRRSKQLKLNLK